MANQEENAVVSLWLTARGAGWKLEDFCKKLEEEEIVPLPPQDVRQDSDWDCVQKRFVGHCAQKVNPSRLLEVQHVFLEPPSRNPLKADKGAGVAAGTPPREDSFIDAQYNRMPHEGFAAGSRSGSKSWIHILLFFLVVVVSGVVLSLFTGDVHNKGLPGEMKVLFPAGLIASFLLLGMLVRGKSTLCRKFYLPSSVIGGLLACVFLQVLRACFRGYDSGTEVLNNLEGAWSSVPGLAINVIFGSLFLGQKVVPVSIVWQNCASQFVYGQILAWGQYSIGFSVGTVLGGYLLPPKKLLFGSILPIGFEGGHGTAAGMQDMFSAVQWTEGEDFCVASATVGLLTGLLVGIVLVNWYTRFKLPAKPPSLQMIEGLEGDEVHTGLQQDENGDFQVLEREDRVDPFEELRLVERERANMKNILKMTYVPRDLLQPSGIEIVQPTSIDNLAYHFGAALLAVMFGYGVKAILIVIDPFIARAIDVEGVFATFPTFPIAMMGGMLIQVGLQRSEHEDKLDTKTLSHVSNMALDLLIVSSIATLRIRAIAQGLVPFLFLMVFGVLWQLFMIFFIAPRFFSDNWFERAICEFGQSTGVTATGLMLLRLIDPTGRNPVYTTFALKQLLHEPLMGGGIWTSLSLPLAYKLGPWVVFGISTTVCVIWSLMYVFYLFPAASPEVTVERLRNRMSINI